MESSYGRTKRKCFITYVSCLVILKFSINRAYGMYKSYYKMGFYFINLDTNRYMRAESKY